MSSLERRNARAYSDNPQPQQGSNVLYMDNQHWNVMLASGAFDLDYMFVKPIGGSARATGATGQRLNSLHNALRIIFAFSASRQRQWSGRRPPVMPVKTEIPQIYAPLPMRVIGKPRQHVTSVLLDDGLLVHCFVTVTVVFQCLQWQRRARINGMSGATETVQSVCNSKMRLSRVTICDVKEQMLSPCADDT